MLRVVEGVGHLGGDVRGNGDRQPRLAAQHLLQGAPLEELHRDVGDAGILADVVDGDDVRMIQAPG